MLESEGVPGDVEVVDFENVKAGDALVATRDSGRFAPNAPSFVVGQKGQVVEAGTIFDGDPCHWVKKLDGDGAGEVFPVREIGDSFNRDFSRVVDKAA